MERPVISLTVTLIMFCLAHGALTDISNQQDCSKIFETTTGKLQSNAYPKIYPANQNCTWRINSPTKHQLLLMFTAFDLPGEVDDGQCDDDYVEIYDVSERNGRKLLGTFCGSSRPVIRSSGSTFIINFISGSDSTNNGGGFRGQWKTETGRCGNMIGENQKQGIFYTPNYPGNYTSGDQCRWLLSNVGRSTIQIKFKQKFLIPGCKDCFSGYVQIFEHHGNELKSLGKFCGNTTPKLISSNAATLSMVFWSAAGSTPGSGFFASFARIGKRQFYQVCDESEGTITSLNYPRVYPSNLDLYYLFIVPPGASFRFQFTSFSLGLIGEDNQCTNDYVEIIEVTYNNTKVSRGRLCGSSLPETFFSQGSQVFLRFRTDSDMGTNGDGFSLSWSTVTMINGQPRGLIPCATGWTSYGALCFHGYRMTGTDDPQVFCKKRNSEVVIQAKSNELISRFVNKMLSTLTVTTKIVVCQRITDQGLTNKDCQCDNGSCQRKSWGQVCQCFQGYKNQDNRCTDINECDSGNGGCHHMCTNTEGSYKCSCRPGYVQHGMRCLESHHCKMMLDQSKGKISTPNYPKIYPENLDCTWIVSSHKDTLPIVLIFKKNFDLSVGTGTGDCVHDRLEIHDYHPEGHYWFLIGTYCGNRIPTHIRTTGHKVKINFISDGEKDNNGMGFVAEYKIESVPCRNLFSIGMDGGLLTTPRYSEPYDNDQSCFWVIENREGAEIKLEFEQFNLTDTSGCSRCECGYVQVFESYLNGSTNELFKMCTKPDVITSSADKLEINFFSVETSVGFIAKWSRIGRPRFYQDLEGTSGTLDSINYPNMYPDNLHILWRITVAYDLLIEINFDTFHVGRKTGSNCNNDYIQIYETLPGKTNHVHGTWCGDESPKKVISRGSVLIILFHSDKEVTNNGQGFYLRWSSGYKVTGKESTLISVPSCEPQWKAYGHNCYRQYNIPMNWNDAKEYCRQQGGHLATIPDDRTQRFFTNHMLSLLSRSSHSVYIGLTQISVQHEFQYTWVNNHKTISFKNFFPHQLKDFGNDKGCVVQWKYTFGHWETVACDKKEFFVCQKHNGEGKGDKDCECDQCTTDMSGAPQCYCNKGYILKGTKCIDIDECAVGSSICDQVCTNTPGSYLCSCREGYMEKGNMCIEKPMCLKTMSLDDESGTLTSPKYPNPYPQNLNCEWHILARAGYVINLRFSVFFIAIETNIDTCGYERLEIIDVNSNGTERIMGTWCGRDDIGKITSSGSQLIVRFVTDSNGGNNADGFLAHYTTEAYRCVKMFDIEQTSGSFRSPNYPNNYGDNLQCMWSIQNKEGCSIELEFEHFDLQSSSGCNSDYVEVIEIDRYGRQGKVYKWCDRSDLKQIISKASRLQVKFVSDSSHSGTGFDASWQRTGAPNYYKVIESRSSFVASINYPSTYPANQDTSWKISVPRGLVIELSFSIFNLGFEGYMCDQDYLEIFDILPDGTNYLMGRYCGFNNPPNLITRGSVLIIKFHTNSDNSMNGNGFYFSYTSGVAQRLQGYRIIIEPLSCPDGWIGYGTDCFQLFQSRKTISEAKTICNRESGHLATITDERTERFITKTVLSQLKTVTNVYMERSYTFSTSYGMSRQITNISTSNSVRQGCVNQFGTEQTCASKQFFTCQKSSVTGIKVGGCGCEQNCRTGSKGNECFCRSGYKAEGTKCKDIDECSENNGGCAHICKNYPGSYKCECQPGFAMYQNKCLKMKIECGGKFQSAKGFFSSPNYPRSYPNSQECQWEINHTNNLTLSFNPRFNLENDRTCSSDSVEVLRGDVSLGKFCGRLYPPPFHSDGKKIVVIFKSDSLNSYTGFSLSWTTCL